MGSRDQRSDRLPVRIGANLSTCAYQTCFWFSLVKAFRSRDAPCVCANRRGRLETEDARPPRVHALPQTRGGWIRGRVCAPSPNTLGGMLDTVGGVAPFRSILTRAACNAV